MCIYTSVYISTDNFNSLKSNFCLPAFIMQHSLLPFHSFKQLTYYLTLHPVPLNFNIHASERLPSTKKLGRQTYPFSVPRNAIYLTSNTFHYSLHLPLNTSSILTAHRSANMRNTHTPDILKPYIEIESFYLGFYTDWA